MSKKATEISKNYHVCPYVWIIPLFCKSNRPFFRLMFYLKSILGYPVNPGLAVSTDPIIPSMLTKNILCQINVQALSNKCKYMEKGIKRGIK